MRATSVIFLIISVVLALIGVLTCAIGAGMAEEQGIELFDQMSDENHNLIYTYNYAGDGIKKIALELGDADVHIIGGSESEYIELINFSRGAYDLTSSNLALSLVDNSNLLKLFAWGSDGINFHGFRHYLYAWNFADKPRAVNIYLTEDSAVKVFELKLGTGSLTLDHISLGFDLSASLETGTLTLSSLSTTSDIVLSVGQGSVRVTDTASRSLTVEAGQADVNLERYASLRRTTVTVEVGDIRLYPTQRTFSGYSLIADAPSGRISVFGQDEGITYREMDSDDEEYTIALTAWAGNVVID